MSHPLNRSFLMVVQEVGSERIENRYEKAKDGSYAPGKATIPCVESQAKSSCGHIHHDEMVAASLHLRWADLSETATRQLPVGSRLKVTVEVID